VNGLAVGRDALCDEAWRHLAARGVVVLEGPAGIGKTTVWRALVERATTAGWRVVSCAPAEPEAGLPLAALAEVLAPLAAGVDALPPPQRRAARMVLLAGDEQEGGADERAVAAATRSLLDGAVAGGTPVLLAVDDAGWADPPSERALAYAVRRLAGRLAVLVTVRDGGARVLDLDRLPVEAARMAVGPLGVGALHHILRARGGARLSRPLLSRIAQQSGGNPLHAIALARAVSRLPRLPSPGEDLPVASSMQQLIADGLATLPAATRQAVRLAALLTVPLVDDLVAAGVAAEDFDAAEEAGLLAVDRDTVTFAHPVYATAVRAGIPPGVRRRLHQRLAGVVADRDERARQLAHGTTAPDEGVAAELAAAADRHARRGAHEAAAALYLRSAALTPRPAGPDAARRSLAAARCHFASGDYAAASAITETLGRDGPGELRSEALLLAAVVAWSADDSGFDTAAALASRALALAEPGSPLAGRIHAHLGLFVDRPRAAADHARAAIALLAADDDRALRAAALMQLVLHEVRAGGPLRHDLLDEAIALESGEPSWLSGTVPPVLWKATDDHGRARDRLMWMLDRAAAHGDEPHQHELLCHLAETEILAGRFADAAGYVSAARDLGEQLGTGLVSEGWLAGLLAAHEGRLADAAVVAESGLRRAGELDDAWQRRIHLQLAGFVALSGGRMAQAAAAYRDLAATVDALDLVEPLAQRFEPDWVEACVATGDLATAQRVLDRLAERHRRLPRPWTALGLARGRALVDAAAGRDPAAALAALDAARRGLPPDVLPLDRARCLLVAGVVHRRARRRRAAREALTRAADEFEAIGAGAFAARARAERDRAGGSPMPAAASHLTPTEERVARLAAAGLTNRVIADRLFISPKTVEANLARVYRKLGIGTRAELGAAMAARSA